MKKIAILIAAAFLAFAPRAAAIENNPEQAKTENKSFQLPQFSAIQASWIFNVELTQSTSCSVEVEAPDFVMPYIQVRVKSNRLVLDTVNLPRDVRRKLERGSYKVLAFVKMPEITGIELSGASRLQAEGLFSTKSFMLELSGATSLQGLRINADKAGIECSGASKFQLSGRLTDLQVELSGAAKGEMESDSNELVIELSGSSKLEIDGKHKNVEVEASAATNLRMKGTAGQLSYTGSGAAKADLSDCPVRDIRVQLSGASSARIHALEKMGVHLSGASSCQYKAGEKLVVTHTDVDRGASLKKL